MIARRTMQTLLLVAMLVLLIYLALWLPVVTKLIFWCDYYPQSLQECRG